MVTVSARGLSATRWTLGAGRSAVHGYSRPLQGVEVAGGGRSTERVQEQRHLAVFSNDPLSLQKPQQPRKLFPFVLGTARPTTRMTAG